ncbi:MAG: hypothetical protein ABSG19_00665 [Candidatus Aminicenantales bacterium]
MNKQILLLVSKSIKVILCIFLIDLIFGEIHRYVFFQQTSGKFYRINYTMDVSTDELLIFGSSHAAAHYVPDVFEKELGLSCYNAGVAGQQILVHKTLQEIMLQRTTPKIMVLDIDTNGFYQDTYHYDRLSDLHPFYSKHADIIGKVLALKSGLTKYFLRSKLYQYNSTIVHVVRYWLAPQRDRKGYQATFVELPKPAQRAPDRREDQPPPVRKTRPFDKNLIAALEQFVLNAKQRNVGLIFTISPTLDYTRTSADDSVEEIRSIADKYGIELINYINNPDFLGHYELFADSGHLNDPGARLFSRMVADKIKQKFPDLLRN